MPNPSVPGAPQSGQPTVAVKPPSTPLPMAFAAEIVNAARNPYLSKLPKIVAAANPETATGQPAEAPVNPLDSVSVVGIVFNAKTPMALLKLEGAGTAETGGGGSQFVRVGETLNVDGREVKITRITADTVDVVEVGKKDNIKNLVLPSIIGYGAAPAAGDTPVGGPEGAGTGPGPSAHQHGDRERAGNIKDDIEKVIGSPTPPKKNVALDKLEEP